MIAGRGMRPMGKASIAGWAFVFVALVGCGVRSAVMPAPAPRDPGPIRPAAALPYDFQWRQRVTARWPEGSQSFEAVLQKQAGELLLLGLSPMGLPGFTLTLKGDGRLRFENRTQRDLPFPPSFIMADVQRVFFPWLPPPAPGFSGIRQGTAEGLHVTEEYHAGQLVTRTFRSDDPGHPGAVHITYGTWMPDQDAPDRVVLDNVWFGYELVIETLTQTRL